MSIDRYTPSYGDNQLDLLPERNLTPEVLAARLAEVAAYNMGTELPLDENGRNPDCDYADELGPNGEPLGDL